ncbi:putative glycosidase C21B10.07 [Cyphellophora attinorum]|uniref:Putative glycosidase C21B10.07 n=1 Tax=Cyphellophora attinorum TaxID=1664694 RepID=A0A0N1HSZ5_9EURO|nr:putative glycosidase C21B10.07 [Phialophora attinorum]KPI41914.1 putative glycosidase C21B10.07 [Phialophora attinorum]
MSASIPLSEKREWRRIVGTVGGVLLTLLIIGGIVVLAIRGANWYPNYSTLNYILTGRFAGEDFFDGFDYYQGHDVALGSARYANQADARRLNLTYASVNSAVLRVDMRDDIAMPDVRTSARIESKTVHNRGLFVFDIRHAPYGCATWSTLRISTRDLGDRGQIDVIGGVNLNNAGRQVALRTPPRGNQAILGSADWKCYSSSESDPDPVFSDREDMRGCRVTEREPMNGAAFNKRGGGVIAVEWRVEGIRAWLFQRHAVPADLSNAVKGSMTSPNVTSWGEAFADFPYTDCDYMSQFKSSKIIVNIGFCGELPGLAQAFDDESKCPGSCQQYLSSQPGSAYSEAYWEFGGFWVFQPYR